MAKKETGIIIKLLLYLAIILLAIGTIGAFTRGGGLGYLAFIGAGLLWFWLLASRKARKDKEN